MNINKLDDLSLLVIFDQLCVEDLLRAGRVCPRWNFIRRKSALTRNSLTIQIGPDLRRAHNAIKFNRFHYVPNKANLLNDQEEPMYPGAQKSLLADLAKREKFYLIRRSTFSLEEARLYAELFVNVQNIVVGISTERHELASLAAMLRLMSTSVRSLKISAYRETTTDNEYDDEEQDEQNAEELLRLTVASRVLLGSICTLKSLRVFHFDYRRKLLPHTGNLTNNLIPLNIVSKLEEFCFNSRDSDEAMVTMVLNSLIQYGPDNKELREIVFPHLTDNIEMFCRITPETALKFSHVYLCLNRTGYPFFSQFCPRFLNLTILHLAIHTQMEYQFSIEPVAFYKSLAKLKQLVSLEIYTDGQIVDDMALYLRNDDDADDDPQWINGLNIEEIKCHSVKTLSLMFSTRIESHYQIAGMSFEIVFPKLQYVLFDHELPLCQNCEDDGVAHEQFGETCIGCMVSPFCLLPDIQAVETVLPDKIWRPEDLWNAIQISEDEDEVENARLRDEIAQMNEIIGQMGAALGEDVDDSDDSDLDDQSDEDDDEDEVIDEKVKGEKVKEDEVKEEEINNEEINVETNGAEVKGDETKETNFNKGNINEDDTKR